MGAGAGIVGCAGAGGTAAGVGFSGEGAGAVGFAGEGSVGGSTGFASCEVQLLSNSPAVSRIDNPIDKNRKPTTTSYPRAEKLLIDFTPAAP